MKHFIMYIIIYAIGCSAHTAFALHDESPMLGLHDAWKTLLRETRTYQPNKRGEIECILSKHPDLHAPLFYTIIGPKISFPAPTLEILNLCIDHYKNDTTLVPLTVAKQCDFLTQIEYLETMQKQVVTQLADDVMYQHGATVKRFIENHRNMSAFLQGISKKLEKLLMQSLENLEDSQPQEHIIWINDSEVRNKPHSSFTYLSSLVTYLMPKKKNN